MHPAFDVESRVGGELGSDIGGWRCGRACGASTESRRLHHASPLMLLRVMRQADTIDGNSIAEGHTWTFV